MMAPDSKLVLVIGSGHLAFRVRKAAAARGMQLVRLSEGAIDPMAQHCSRFEVLVGGLGHIDLDGLAMAILVDDHDDRNLELAIALISISARLPIVASIFNENIAPHLQAAHPNLRVLNPARVAAPVFVDALNIPLRHELRYAPKPFPEHRAASRGDRLIRTLVSAFVLLLAAATTYFHFAEGLSWLDSLYFVSVTMSTVGYGDISLLHSSAASKLAGIGLIAVSTGFIWMIFSLTVDNIIKKRVQMALGHRKHKQRGHVIVCGLGRLGFLVAEELLGRGERVLVVERNPDSPALESLRSLGADAYIGDARFPRVLHDAGVTRAKALYSLVGNDFVNLEVGLNARSFDPGLRLILRIFDETMSRCIREQLDIHLSFSMSAIADEKFLQGVAVEP